MQMTTNRCKESSDTLQSSVATTVRNSPCRLFIPSAQSQQICIICGFFELAHCRESSSNPWCNSSSKKPPLPPGCHQQQQPPPQNRGVNCRNGSYDVRVEYLPRSSFQAKYGAKLPVLLGDDNYVQLRSSSSVATQRAPLDTREPVSDSEVIRFDNGNRCWSRGIDKFDWNLKSRSSKGTPLLQRENNSSSQTLAIREGSSSVQTLTSDESSFADDMIKNPIMLSPSKTSAFDEYSRPGAQQQPVIFAKTSNVPANRKKPPAPPPPPPRYAEPLAVALSTKPNPYKQTQQKVGVKFQPTTSIISCEGGQEYFFADPDNVGDNDDDDEDANDNNGAGDKELFDDLLIAQEDSDFDGDDEIDWIDKQNFVNRLSSAKRSVFDKITESNTEFNSNPKNLACPPAVVAQPEQKPDTKFLDKEIHKEYVLNTGKNGAENLKNGKNAVASLGEREKTFSVKISSIPAAEPPTVVVKRPQSLLLPTISNGTECNDKINGNICTTVDNSSATTTTLPIVIQRSTVAADTVDTNNSDETPSPSKDLSELSSNLSSSAEASMHTSPEHQNGVNATTTTTATVRQGQKQQEVVAAGNNPIAQNGETTIIYTGRKTGKFNKNIDDRLKQMAMDLESQRKCPKRPAPPPPPPAAYANFPSKSSSKKTINKSNSAAVLPDLPAGGGPGSNGHVRHSVDRSLTVDINVCQHLPNTRRSLQNGRSVSQDRSLRSTPDSDSGRGKFASIRKFLRFEQRDSQITSKFQSLRRLPSPFSRSRIDLNQIKGLFHGVEKCTASDEIANDSDVVVTDITEVHSTVNTLTRHGHVDVNQQSIYDNDKDIIFNDSRQNDIFNNNNNNQDGFVAMQPVINKMDSLDAVSSVHSQHSNASGNAINNNNNNHRNTNFKEEMKKSIKSLFRENSPMVVGVQQRQQANGIYPNRNSSRGYATRNSYCVGDVPVAEQQQQPDHRKSIEETYDQITLGHAIALSQTAENFPDAVFQWKRKASPIVDTTSLKWSDFSIVSNSPVMVTDSAAFYPAVLKVQQELLELHVPKVNIMITPVKYSNPVVETYQQKTRRPFFLPVVSSFQEYVPAKLLRLTNFEESDDNNDNETSSHPIGNHYSDSESLGGGSGNNAMTLCRINVTPRMLLTGIDGYADQTANRHHPLKQPTLHEKDVCFVMIQLITALKYLQSHGIEEVGSDLDGFLLIRSGSARTPHLVLCSPEGTSATSSLSSGRISLCQCALATLCLLLHTEVPTEELLREKRVPDFATLSTYTDGFQKVADLLNEEKSFSLTQCKTLLEHMYWVSNHLSIIDEANVKFESETAAKFWLEKERAKQVCNLLKLSLKQCWDDLDIVEEYRIQFLLNTSAKQLYDAGNVLDDHKNVIIV